MCGINISNHLCAIINGDVWSNGMTKEGIGGMKVREALQ